MALKNMVWSCNLGLNAQHYTVSVDIEVVRLQGRTLQD